MEEPRLEGVDADEDEGEHEVMGHAPYIIFCGDSLVEGYFPEAGRHQINIRLS